MDQYRKWCQQGFRVIKHIVYCRCIPIDRNGISVIIPDGGGAGSAQLRYPNLWPITTRSTASTASTTLVISEDSTIKSEDFAPGAAAGDGEAPPSGLEAEILQLQAALQCVEADFMEIEQSITAAERDMETNEKEIDEMAQELASIEKLYDDLISPDKNSPER